MWKDCDWIDRNFTRSDILMIYNATQNRPIDDEKAERMDYEEFKAALVAVALAKNGNPFLPEALKVEQCIANQYIPLVYKKHPRLRA